MIHGRAEGIAADLVFAALRGCPSREVCGGDRASVTRGKEERKSARRRRVVGGGDGIEFDIMEFEERLDESGQGWVQ